MCIEVVEKQKSAGGPRRATRSILWACLIAALLALTVFTPATPPASAAAPSASSTDSADPAVLAVELSWTDDSADEFAERFGDVPALFGFALHLPLTGSSSLDLDKVATQAASHGAGLVITVKPHAGLTAYDEAIAHDVAMTIGRATRWVEGPVLVRFGPQMNTPWVGWGMQPSEYVEDFRATTKALEEVDPDIITVWSPQTREGYPFPMDASSPARAMEPTAGSDLELDTNVDGEVNSLDDAYAPFFPGAEHVDWVGLSALYDPQVPPGTATPVPAPGLAQEMLGTAEGADPNGFYQRYAIEHDKPLLLDTGAAYRQGEGPADWEVKSAWWDQVLSLPDDGYGRLAGILLHDVSSTHADGRYVDQRLTSHPDLAAALHKKVVEHGLRLGPVAEPVDVDVRLTGTTLDRTASWIVVGVVLAVTLLGLALATWSPRFRRLRYPDESKRDLRVDLLRGMAILFVVVDHLGLTSLFHLGSQEAIGIVSGAELFVVLAGVILGIVSRPRMAVGIYEAVDRGWSRARKLYLWALLVPLAVFALSFVPWLNTTAVTTYSSPSQGPVGATSPASTYNLFAGLDGLLQYPVDPAVIPRLLTLQFGPWQFNILGLYVILLLVSPFVLHALHRGWTLRVLAVSVGCYVLSQVTGWRVLPFQSDDAFPILAWQLIFVLGLVAGFFWRELVHFLTKGWGRLVLVLCVLAATGFMLLSWNNPYLSNIYDVRLGLISPSTFNPMYGEWFSRTFLRLGRLLNVIVLLVGAFALLTALWKPINAVLGWLLIPLGRASLYVFIMHVFLIIVITNIPLVAYGSIWLNTGAYVVVIMTLWLMVKTRFLYRFIPT